MLERHRMPAPSDPVWGQPEVRWPDNTPDWFLPFEQFLEEHSPVFKKTLWRRVLSRIGYPVFSVCWGRDGSLDLNLPGDEEGVTAGPRLIQLSMRVRWNLFREFYYRPSTEILRKWRREGAFILFRQVAYAEFWLAGGFLTWPLAWRGNKSEWASRADQQARVLLTMWEQRQDPKERAEKRKDPPLDPLSGS